ISDSPMRAWATPAHSKRGREPRPPTANAGVGHAHTTDVSSPFPPRPRSGSLAVVAPRTRLPPRRTPPMHAAILQPRPAFLPTPALYQQPPPPPPPPPAKDAHTPPSPKPPHFAPKAKACICIYLEGAPSQLDLFDPKPKLNDLDGKPMPESLTKEV